MPKRGNKDDNMRMEGVGAIAEVHCESKVESYMDNPVVGWLVVIKGKGQGCFVRLGYGINSIGRSNTNRVSLNFGDNEISPERHIVLIYDTRQREFFIQQGEGKNAGLRRWFSVIAVNYTRRSKHYRDRRDPIEIGDFMWSKL